MEFKTIYNRDGFRKDGTASIHIYISHNRKLSYINTGIKCTPSEYNNLSYENQLIINGINEKILKFLAQRKLQNRSFDLDSLIKYVKSGASTSFVEFVKSKLSERKISESTKKKHIDLINKLKDFRDVIKFSDIDEDLINAFYRYLENREKYGGGKMKVNAIAQIMILFRSYVKAAYSDGLIFEYRGIKIKKERTEQFSLNMDDIRALEGFSDKYIDRVLFMFFTGLRISDTNYNFKELISDGVLTLRPQKTSKHFTDINLPLKYLFWGKPLEILERNNYKFYKCSPKTTNEHFKKVLKELRYPIYTSKICRHSFITNLWSMGMPEDYIALLVGHSRSSMTSRYGTRPVDQIVRVVKDCFS